MSRGPMTAKRVTRRYRIEIGLIWGYRSFLILYSTFLVGMMVYNFQQFWYYPIYLALNVVWWWLSIRWVRDARYARDERYRAVELTGQIQDTIKSLQQTMAESDARRLARKLRQEREDRARRAEWDLSVYDEER